MSRPGSIEEGLRECLRGAPSEVVCAYLFGSVARGEVRVESDVDVAVLYEKTPASRLDAGPLDLEGELERALGRPVQLVVLNRAPADLVHRVLRDGRIVLDRDPRRAHPLRGGEAQRVLRSRAASQALPRHGSTALVTDPELIAKKLAVVGTCCRELRERG